MAHILWPDGTVSRDINPGNGKTYTFPEVRKHLRFTEGRDWLEPVHGPFGLFGLVDEEGLLKGLPVNQAASLLFNNRIVGPMFVCDRSEID